MIKKLLIIIPIVFYLSCSSEIESSSAQQKKESSAKNLNKSSCLDSLNQIFLDLGDSNLVITDFSIVHPKFIENFYTDQELSVFLFLNLVLENREQIVAIDTFHKSEYHVLHFCDLFKDQYYIDESSELLLNLNFLNNCNIKIDEIPPVIPAFTENFWDQRLIGNWTIDSINGNDQKVSTIEFTKNRIIINKLDTTLYYQEAFQFIKSIDSTLFMERVALSKSKLLLHRKINNESNFYYLNKN